MYGARGFVFVCSKYMMTFEHFEMLPFVLNCKYLAKKWVSTCEKQHQPNNEVYCMQNVTF